MGAMKLFMFLAIVSAATTTTHATLNTDQIIRLVAPGFGAGRHRVSEGSCLSWRLAVETYNLRGWTLVPEACKDYIANYMLGKQHQRDCEAVVDIAIEYAQSVNLTGDGKDAWVLDIDQTSLSLLPYYAQADVQFGAIAYNDTKFEAWLATGAAPANPAVLRLYKKLISIGIKIVFISGTSESQREIRVANLKKAGYYTWEQLMLKQTSEKGTTAAVYKTKKRTQLVGEGYRILGNMGDQWSDLIGENNGNRTFKLPNPMFYIP